MRERIARIALDSIGLNRCDIGHPQRDKWCGAFVCYVLEQAGLLTHYDCDRPGFELVRSLSAVEPHSLAKGDVIRYVAGLEHYAMMTDIKKTVLGFSLTIVEGTSDDGKVTSAVRNITPFDHGLHWPREYYSIAPLIERYYWTGANPEVA